MIKLIVPLAVVASMLACGGGSVDARAIRLEWQSRAPSSYVARECETGFSAPFCTASAVQSFEPIETWQRDLKGDWSPSDSLIDPVELIISSLEHNRGCDERATLDETYGYPASTHFDCGEEGYGYKVDCFVDDTVDVSRCR